MNQINFILVRPCFLGNIGSTARVMKNFGFRNLVLVAPPKNYKDAEARKMSVGAFDVLKQAQVYASLPPALADANLVIGTSSGQQRARGSEPLDNVLQRVAAASATNKIAILFGDERDGLSNDELAMCHHITTIGSDKEFPSLNVSHAVAVVAYRLSQLLIVGQESVNSTDPTSRARESQKLATVTEEEELFAYIESLFTAVEFTRTYNRELVLGQLKAFYRRARPTKRECDLLKGVILRLNRKLSGFTSDN
ncbi:MAG TPA: RNA methyltransferase [Chroococcales cyanobacterium]